jgi:hypothetical protein
MQTEVQKETVVNNALGVLRNVADRIDWAVYEKVRAAGRLEGEKAMHFELRCMDEAVRK